jgi:uncharacterized protein
MNPGAMRDKVAVLVPFVLIFVAEAFYFAQDSTAALSLHLLNIFLCVLFAIFVERYSDLFQALMLVSLLRVMNIGMPTFFNMTLYWLPLVYGTVILSAYILWRVAVTTIPADDLGKMSIPDVLRDRAHRAWEFINGGAMAQRSQWNYLYIPAALVIGLALADIEYLVLGPEALIPDLGFFNLTVLAVVMVVFVGFGEELVFRGFVQARMESHWGVYVGVFGSALIFSVMHSGYENVTYLFFVFFVGMILAVLFWKTRSLMFVALIHGVLNFFLYSLMPYGWGIKF